MGRKYNKAGRTVLILVFVIIAGYIMLLLVTRPNPSIRHGNREIVDAAKELASRKDDSSPAVRSLIKNRLKTIPKDNPNYSEAQDAIRSLDAINQNSRQR